MKIGRVLCMVMSPFALLRLVIGAEDFGVEREGRLREPRGLGR